MEYEMVQKSTLFNGILVLKMKLNTFLKREFGTNLYEATRTIHHVFVYMRQVRAS